MGKGRLEAFSDGVIAIIITIMVLELRAPQGTTLADLRPLAPLLLTYALSFAYVGIYWNNHHHLLGTVDRVSGAILWANLHLLFWLSLVPFATRWLGENHGASGPTALYGVVLLLAALAYVILQRQILAGAGPGSELAHALGRQWKEKGSLAGYAAAIALAYVAPFASDALYFAIAVMWFVPDRRIEAIARA